MKKIFLIYTLIILSMPAFAYNNEPIKDELIDPKVYGDINNNVFQLGIYERVKNDNNPIKDELIDNDFKANALNYAIKQQEHPDDFFFEKNIDTATVRKILPKTKYDFTKQQIPIKIQIAQPIKTKDLIEGSVINFISADDFEINGKKFQKGTPVIGRVEILSAADKMGVPETIKIDNFYIKDEGREINFTGSVSKTGANRSIWIYPLYQAGNITLYAAGFILVPIHGGRVKLKPSEIFTVYFEQ